MEKVIAVVFPEEPGIRILLPAKTEEGAVEILSALRTELAVRQAEKGGEVNSGRK